MLRKNCIEIKEATLIGPTISKYYLTTQLRILIKFLTTPLGKLVLNLFSRKPNAFINKYTIYFGYPQLLFKKNINRKIYSVNLSSSSFKQWARSVLEIHEKDLEDVLIKNSEIIKLIYAEHDNVVSAKSFRKLSEKINLKVYEIKNSDHNPHETNAKEVVDIIKS
jgi:pimeloyl-ACP methyl ester carboxylesterase